MTCEYCNHPLGAGSRVYRGTRPDGSTVTRLFCGQCLGTAPRPALPPPVTVTWYRPQPKPRKRRWWWR